MTNRDRWLLPEGIEELLPPQADALENLRRQLLDCYRSWGYELIMPPFIEYLESLLTGTGGDLDLQTFKITDSLTGRQMGVRADMTPQAARIDAHQLKRDVPVRLCYLGTVLRTRPEGFSGSRTPLQVGAELFGHSGIDSDLEILEVMLETLALTGVEPVIVDLGHVGIFRGLARQAGLDAEQEAALFDALQRKAVPEINELLDVYSSTSKLSSKMKGMFSALSGLSGGDEVLKEAGKVLKPADKAVKQALEELVQISGQLLQRRPDVQLHYDLAELRGYNYQSGIVFAAYVPGFGQEVARGGRYDGIGEIFGRSRSATGFSADLKTLVELSKKPSCLENAGTIFAPADNDPALRLEVDRLRKTGERVIYSLSNQQGGGSEMGCNRKLEQQDGQWKIVSL
ncbi:MAG: ATP phosphoribosyltransferase regulatory subunit [Gammaproteobacteria bacterium]|nr:ATP phosphoribosyltransferase regulatory subunit [Gammaproteobacteria bacterium]